MRPFLDPDIKPPMNELFSSTLAFDFLWLIVPFLAGKVAPEPGLGGRLPESTVCESSVRESSDATSARDNVAGLRGMGDNALGPTVGEDKLTDCRKCEGLCQWGVSVNVDVLLRTGASFTTGSSSILVP